MDNVLEGLNDEQKEAVTHDGGPLLIVAGAGTGKTTVMVRRIAWLLAEGKARSSEILALTFTEKASAEMEERVDRMLPYGATDVWISTFHGFCQRVLEEIGVAAGYSDKFVVMNETDTRVFLRAHFKELPLSLLKPKGNSSRFLHALHQHISRAKDEGVNPEKYRAFAETVSDADERARLIEIAECYEKYEALLEENHLLDFGSLLMLLYKIFNERPDLLSRYQNRFKEIMVDEFQDTNWIQYELVKMITGDKKALTVVGDDDQSIYAFRGATVANILRFSEDFPGTKLVVLTKNYRSLQSILNIATNFIRKNNPHRLEEMLIEKTGKGKELVSGIEGEAIISHRHFSSAEEEAKGVAEEISRVKQETGADWSDFAILVRANDHATPFADALKREGIPYRFFGESGLYKMPVILDIMSVLRAVDRPDDSPSLFRALSHPRLGLKNEDVLSLTEFARRKGKTLWSALLEHDDTVIADKEKVKRFIDILDELRTLSRVKNAYEMLVLVANKSGILAEISKENEENREATMQYLKQFAERVRRFVRIDPYGSLHDFLDAFEEEANAGEEGDLGLDIQSGPDEVRLLTMHGAKGLEFRFVFLSSLVDRRMPQSRHAQPLPLHEGLVHNRIPGEDPHIEEERRLFYVAITRAKERLTCTSAEYYGGVQKKKPSIFLNDIGIINTAVELGREGMREDAKSGEPLIRSATQQPGPLSFSSITTYLHCPLQYKCKHIWGIPILGSSDRSFGISVHGALEVAGRIALEHGVWPSTELAKNILKKVWVDDWYESEDEEREAFNKALASFEKLLKDESSHTLTLKFLEQNFKMSIGSVLIKGKIDRVDDLDGGVEIFDYKTGKAKSDDDLEFDDKMQLFVYQIAVGETLGLEVKRLTLYYINEGVRVSFLGNEKELKKTSDIIQKVGGDIAEGEFGATPGFVCERCEYKSICPFRTI